MKIAFISYEFPPDTAGGGIGTYVGQAAALLQQRGHHVEVFTASPSRLGCEEERNGVRVHRVIVKDGRRTADFSPVVAPLFAERHRQIGFDVLEGPDFAADARDAIKLVPDIPLVIRLHTPSCLFTLLRLDPTDFRHRFGAAPIFSLRSFLSNMIRGHRPLERPMYLPWKDLERIHALEADEFAAPSLAIRDLMIRIWQLDPDRVHSIPNPYIPSPHLLNVFVGTTSNHVSFVGRLEFRKGCIDFAHSIPLIRKHRPDARFLFIGRSLRSPDPRKGMQRYIEDLLGRHQKAVDFLGSVPPERIPSLLALSDVCVFPSLWENFPYICLEAMAAARAIVASSAGGMAEMLPTQDYGRLVPPRRPRSIATAVVTLLQDPDTRIRMGLAARQRVLQEYNGDRVGNLMEESYARAIERRKRIGPRPPFTAPTPISRKLP